MNSIIRLPEFGFLAITGQEARSFFQGYTTCDVEQITEPGIIGAICNLQGRMVTNFRIADIDSGILLRMHRSRVQETMTFLSRYIVFSKAELIDATEQWHCYGVLDTDINGVETSAPDQDQVMIRVSSSRSELWSHTVIDGASSFDAIWQELDCQEGLAWVQNETAELFLPQMFNLHNIQGIDFSKGCYLGQEIIARLHYRGALKRKLHHGKLLSRVAVGTELLREDGRTIGNIVAVAPSGAKTSGEGAVQNHWSALAVLQNAGDNPLTVQPINSNSVEFSPV